MIFSVLHVFSCFSSLKSKPTKTIVTRSVLAHITSSTVMMHFFITCINIPYSFKFSSLFLLSTFYYSVKVGNVWSDAIFAMEAVLPVPINLKALKGCCKFKRLLNYSRMLMKHIHFLPYFFMSLSQLSLQCVNVTQPHRVRREQWSWSCLSDFLYILGKKKIIEACRIFFPWYLGDALVPAAWGHRNGPVWKPEGEAEHRNQKSRNTKDKK